MGLLKSSLLVVGTAIAVSVLPGLLRPSPPVIVNGSCRPEFKAVQDAFRKNFEEGRETGAAFAAYHKGELVCDLWGGYSDLETLRPWKEDSVNCFYSSTKGISAIMLAMLYDRGLFEYDDLVSKYWPEFAQNGKDNVTMRILASHQAGVAALDEHITTAMLLNQPEEVGRILAAQKPNWPPGTRSGYHGLTFGVLLDQLVRRLDPQHRGLPQFFREEVVEPFDLDINIGLPFEEQYRATTIEFSFLTFLVNSLLEGRIPWLLVNFMFSQGDPVVAGSFKNVGDHLPLGANNWPEKRVEPNPSVSGYGTARSLAKFYGIVANGGSLGGQTLMSARGLEILDDVVIRNIDRVTSNDVSWGYGLNIVSLIGPDSEIPVFGTSGFGGQLGYANKEEQLSIAYITNNMDHCSKCVDRPRAVALTKPLLEVILKK